MTKVLRSINEASLSNAVYTPQGIYGTMRIRLRDSFWIKKWRDEGPRNRRITWYRTVKEAVQHRTRRTLPISFLLASSIIPHRSHHLPSRTRKIPYRNLAFVCMVVYPVSMSLNGISAISLSPICITCHPASRVPIRYQLPISQQMSFGLIIMEASSACLILPSPFINTWRRWGKQNKMRILL
jgi:hypothetical protein